MNHKNNAKWKNKANSWTTMEVFFFPNQTY